MPGCFIWMIPAVEYGTSLATPNGEPSHLPSMAGRVATATALGSRDCHHIEATAAPAQMHRSCSAPPLSNAGGKRQALTECGMNARARGEKQHGVGAGRPHSWRLRLCFSPNEAWRAWRRSRFAHLRRRSLNVRPADTPRGDCGQCAGLTAGPKNLSSSW